MLLYWGMTGEMAQAPEFKAFTLKDTKKRDFFFMIIILKQILRS